MNAADNQAVPSPTWAHFNPSIEHGRDGSMKLLGLRGMSARITNKTRCHGCGELVGQAGVEIIADLAVNPDDALVWHKRCKPRPVDKIHDACGSVE